jgi:hypothetical protein
METYGALMLIKKAKYPEAIVEQARFFTELIASVS